MPFNGLNGQSPSSAPVCVSGNHKLRGEYSEEWCFGTTYLGGTMNAGTLYRIKPDGSRHEVLFSFDIQHGLTPSQQPAISPDRLHLYGVTSQGGENGSASGVSVGAGQYILLGVSGGSAHHIGSLISVPIPASVR